MTQRTCNKNSKSNLTHQNPIELCEKQRIYFRDLFRSARAKAQKNLESFHDILFALEKLGLTIKPSPIISKHTNLGAYKDRICDFIETGSIDEESPYYISPEQLYILVKDYRNDALHQGSVARNLTSRAIHLSLLIEGALMSEQYKVNAYMVSNVTVAEIWHPISLIRQQMLENSFSYIPYIHNGVWYIISDYDIVKYLKRDNPGKDKLTKRLSMPLGEIIGNHDHQVFPQLANICYKDQFISNIINTDKKNDSPFIVVDKDNVERILGIITPFDIL